MIKMHYLHKLTSYARLERPNFLYVDPTSSPVEYIITGVAITLFINRFVYYIFDFTASMLLKNRMQLEKSSATFMPFYNPHSSKQLSTGNVIDILCIKTASTYKFSSSRNEQ